MKGKTAFLFGIFFVGIFALCGCGKKTAEMEKKEWEADFVYPVTIKDVFCLDEEGNLYTYVEETRSICIFASDGTQVKQIETEPVAYHELCYGNGVLYAFVSIEDAQLSKWYYLAEVSLEDGSHKKIYEASAVYGVCGLFFCNENLCFIEKKEYSSATAENLNDPMGEYYYYGEQLVCFSTETMEKEEIPIERVKTVTKKKDTEIWVYAYDMDYGRYYFAVYDLKAKSLEEKSYVDDQFNVFLDRFAYDIDSDRLLRVNMITSSVVAMNPEEINSQSSFYNIEAVSGASDRILCADGRTYFLVNGQIQRIKNSNYIKNYAPIKIYHSTFEYTIPEGTGFEINMINVDEDTMAMSMMAGDNDYDFLLLSTDSSVAEQIRRVGAYEPLNAVEGIETYMQNSFDFMRTAATDENGAIWMLPCDVSCEVLLYNPMLCKKYGIDLEQNVTVATLRKAQQALREAEKGKTPSYYVYSFAKDCYRLMDMYLADNAVVDGNACFDTELFRTYSKMFQEEQGQGMYQSSQYAKLNPGGNVPGIGATEEAVTEYFDEYFSQVALVAADKNILEKEYSNSVGGKSYRLLEYAFFQAKAMPVLEADKAEKTIASAFILVLNPNSAHLAEAKEFLTVLAERMNTEESIFRTKELKKTYNALEISVHEIYADARIVFSYPSDVFWKEYLKFLNGEKSLDEVIPELERKLNLYLKE